MKKTLKERKADYLLLLSISTILLFIPLVFIFGLGFDKKMITGTVEGFITDTGTQPITSASVCLNNLCVQTNEHGYYKIESVTSGTFPLVVSTSRHQDITESVKVRKGTNTINLTLNPAELTNAQIQFLDSGGQIVQEGLNIRLQDELVTMDVENVVLLSQIKTGKYIVSVESAYYVDQQTEIYLEANRENQYSIALEPSVSFALIVQNWLDLSPIKNAIVTIPGLDNFQSDASGKIVFTDIPKSTQFMTVKKDGYLNKVFHFEGLLAGVNPDITVSLVEDEQIVFTKKTATGKQVFISNIDGSDLTQLTTEGENYQPWLDKKNGKVFFAQKQTDNRDLIYSIDILGERLELLSAQTLTTTPRKLEFISYEKDIRIYTEDVGGDKVSFLSSKLDDSNIVDYPDLNELIYNKIFLSEDANTLLYSISEDPSRTPGIYSTALRHNRTIKLMDSTTSIAEGGLVIHSSSTNNQELGLSIGTEIFTYDIGSKDLMRLTEDGLTKTEIKFQPNSSRLSYIVESDTRPIILIDPTTKESTRLTPEGHMVDSYKWLSENTLLYTSRNQLWITATKNPTQPQTITESGEIN